MSRINIAQVKAGMIVDEAIYTPDGDQLLLQYGAVITPQALVRLKFYGVETLAVSVQDSYFISPSQTMSIFLGNFFNTKISEISPEFPEGNINDGMLDTAQRVKRILNDILKDHVLLDLCMEIKIVDNQKLFYPSIYSCVRAVLVAGAMGLPDDEVGDIAAAALIQNLGLCEMPFLLGVARRDLKQETLWREHCQYGYYFAKERGISNEIAQLILDHHEQYDGSGYPNQRRGDEIPVGARIINLCSDFDAMQFGQKMQPYQIADVMYQSADVKYDSRVVDAFIMNIPLYPLGSVVRLSNQEVGVVVNIRKNIGARPVVRVCYNRCNKLYTDSRIVDLGEEADLYIAEVLA